MTESETLGEQKKSLFQVKAYSQSIAEGRQGRNGSREKWMLLTDLFSNIACIALDNLPKVG